MQLSILSKLEIKNLKFCLIFSKTACNIFYDKFSTQILNKSIYG